MTADPLSDLLAAVNAKDLARVAAVRDEIATNLTLVLAVRGAACAGYSHRQIAGIVGVSHPTIAAWVDGTTTS